MSVETPEKTRKEMVAGSKQELTGAETTRPGRVFTPPVDIFETDEAITVLADLPGVRSDGLAIDLRDNVLTIDGAVNRIGDDDRKWLVREYETGSFYRQFRLSKSIDQSRIDAKIDDGVLRLTLPKTEAVLPRKIEVRTS